MESIKKVILYGFLIWLIPFVVAFIIFPIHESNRPLFESIMPVTVALCVVIFGNMYFKQVEANYKKEGIRLGIIWLIISLVIDLILFMPQSPMHLSFLEYLMDIGITYLMIPVITIGFGCLLNKK
ncbi:MAG: hypothetical protein GWP19_14755 [Planctomycetia bacterium]|nr:hypothetical protein [Planctomycetia bacterium]